MDVLRQKHSVITFDLAIYMKAKEIQWRRPEEFKNTVIRMGAQDEIRRLRMRFHYGNVQYMQVSVA